MAGRYIHQQRCQVCNKIVSYKNSLVTNFIPDSDFGPELEERKHYRCMLPKKNLHVFLYVYMQFFPITDSFTKIKPAKQIWQEISRLTADQLLVIMKTIYLADLNHIKIYARTITKKPCYLSTNMDFAYPEVLFQYLHHDKRHVMKMNLEIDMDELSESDIECLNHAIPLTFYETMVLPNYSKLLVNEFLSLEQLAKLAGCNDEMIKYVLLNEENQNAFQ